MRISKNQKEVKSGNHTKKKKEKKEPERLLFFQVRKTGSFVDTNSVSIWQFAGSSAFR